MDVLDYGSLVAIGAVASLAVGLIKKICKTNEYVTLGVVIGVSLVVGIIYQLFNAATWWDGFMNTLVYAGAVYVYLWKRFEK